MEHLLNQCKPSRQVDRRMHHFLTPPCFAKLYTTWITVFCIWFVLNLLRRSCWLKGVYTFIFNPLYLISYDEFQLYHTIHPILSFTYHLFHLISLFLAFRRCWFHVLNYVEEASSFVLHSIAIRLCLSSVVVIVPSSYETYSWPSFRFHLTTMFVSSSEDLLVMTAILLFVKLTRDLSVQGVRKVRFSIVFIDPSLFFIP